MKLDAEFLVHCPIEQKVLQFFSLQLRADNFEQIVVNENGLYAEC